MVPEGVVSNFQGKFQNTLPGYPFYNTQFQQATYFHANIGKKHKQTQHLNGLRHSARWVDVVASVTRIGRPSRGDGGGCLEERQDEDCEDGEV